MLFPKALSNYQKWKFDLGKYNLIIVIKNPVMFWFQDIICNVNRISYYLSAMLDM